MEVRGALSAEQIGSFLEEMGVPVRLGCRTPADRPWMVSLWYRYRDGTLECSTAKDADLVRYLEHDDRVSFEVSTNEQPYRGVRGRGPATVAEDAEKTVLRDLLGRYQGGTDTDLGEWLLREDREEVSITIDPVVVYGWDYSDRMGAGPE